MPSNQQTAVGRSPEYLRAGRQLRSCHFNWFAGRTLRDILDPLGRVYRPNPYDVPQWRYRILSFCIEFIISMIDTGVITEKSAEGYALLERKEDVWKLKELLRSIGNSITFFDSVRGEDGVPWDPSIRLLNPEVVRKHKQHDCAPKGHWNRHYDTTSIKVAARNKLVVVATVRAWGACHRPTAEDLRWTLAFDVTEGSGKAIFEGELHAGWYVDVQLFEVPKKVVDDPASLATNQNPQFLLDSN